LTTEEYLTTDELSERIKMKPGTIRNLVSNGKFILNVHYVKPTPKKILYVWSAVEEWLYNPGQKRNQNVPTETFGKPIEKTKDGCLLNI